MLCVHHLEVNRYALGLTVLIVHAGHVQHLIHEIGALDMARMLRARHGERHVAGAACDVQHVGVLVDGRLAHHARQPCLVRAEAGDGVEPLVFFRDGGEDVFHAFGRDVRGRFLAGSGIDAHR